MGGEGSWCGFTQALHCLLQTKQTADWVVCVGCPSLVFTVHCLNLLVLGRCIGLLLISHTGPSQSLVQASLLLENAYSLAAKPCQRWQQSGGKLDGCGIAWNGGFRLASQAFKQEVEGNCRLHAHGAVVRKRHQEQQYKRWTWSLTSEVHTVTLCVIHQGIKEGCKLIRINQSHSWIKQVC